MENITDHRLLDQIARETGAKIGGELYTDALSPSRRAGADLSRHVPAQCRRADRGAVVLICPRTQRAVMGGRLVRMAGSSGRRDAGGDRRRHAGAGGLADPPRAALAGRAFPRLFHRDRDVLPRLAAADGCRGGAFAGRNPAGDGARADARPHARPGDRAQRGDRRGRWRRCSPTSLWRSARTARKAPPEASGAGAACAKCDVSSAHGDESARRRAIPVRIGNVTIGGDAPIVVQSMTNTDTADIEATTAQVAALARAGSELVRITVDRAEAAAAVPHIKERLDRLGVEAPLIGDFHYNGHTLLERASGLRRGARQIPHQSRQCRLQGQARPAIRRDRRDRAPPRQGGAHRGELGQPRSGAAHPADGRERDARRSRKTRAR